MAVGDALRRSIGSRAEAQLLEQRASEGLIDDLQQLTQMASRRREAQVTEQRRVEKVAQTEATNLRVGELKSKLQREAQGDVAKFQELFPEEAEEGFRLKAFAPRRVTEKVEEPLTGQERLTAAKGKQISDILDDPNLTAEEKVIQAGQVGKVPKALRISDIKFARGEAIQKSLREREQVAALATFDKLGIQTTAEQAFQEFGDEAERAGVDIIDGLEVVSALSESYFEDIEQGLPPETAVRRFVTAIDDIGIQFPDLTREQLIPLAQYVIRKIEEGGKR